MNTKLNKIFISGSLHLRVAVQEKFLLNLRLSNYGKLQQIYKSKVSTFVKNAQVSVQKILGRRTLPSQHFPFSQCCYSKYEGKVKLEILMKFHKNIVKVLSLNQNYFSFRCTWIFSWANGWKVRAAVLTILETFSNFSVASQSL